MWCLSSNHPCYTDPVQKSLTLTIDEDVLREARKVALDRKTSVNQLVREYLTRHIVHELGPREYQGMELFLSWARQPQPSGASAG